MDNKIDANHNQKRKVLRIVGPIILVAGLIFIAIGQLGLFSSVNNVFSGVFGGILDEDMSFSSSMSSPFVQGTKLFGYNFIGVPLVFIGSILTIAGYIGAVARYQAEEIVPVKKDIFNYMAEGTSGGIKTIAKSIHDGITGSDTKTAVCPKCNQNNTVDSKYCNSCGEALNQIIKCENCNTENDMNSKFCNNCGNKF